MKNNVSEKEVRYCQLVLGLYFDDSSNIPTRWGKICRWVDCQNFYFEEIILIWQVKERECIINEPESFNYVVNSSLCLKECNSWPNFKQSMPIKSFFINRIFHFSMSVPSAGTWYIGRYVIWVSPKRQCEDFNVLDKLARMSANWRQRELLRTGKEGKFVSGCQGLLQFGKSNWLPRGRGDKWTTDPDNKQTEPNKSFCQI